MFAYTVHALRLQPELRTSRSATDLSITIAATSGLPGPLAITVIYQSVSFLSETMETRAIVERRLRRELLIQPSTDGNKSCGSEYLA